MTPSSQLHELKKFRENHSISSMKQVKDDQHISTLKKRYTLDAKALAEIKNSQKSENSSPDLSSDTSNKLNTLGGLKRKVDSMMSQASNSDLVAKQKIRALGEVSCPDSARKYLRELFYGIEGVVTFYKGRSQTHDLTFHKIQRAVTNSTGRNFQLSHLARIVNIFPQSYLLTPIVTVLHGQRINSLKIDWPDQQDSKVLSDGKLTHSFNSSVFVMKQAESRKKTFLQLLKEKVPETAKIDDIREAKLPPLNESISEANINNNNVESSFHGRDSDPKTTTLNSRTDNEDNPKNFNDNLDSKQTVLKHNPLLNPSTITLTDGSSPSSKSSKASEATNKKPPTVLERVRLRQKQRSMENRMRLSKEVLRQRSMMSRLPEFVDLIDSHFSDAKRGAMYMNEITKKLVKTSNTPMSDFEAKQYIDMLVNFVPEWCSVLESEFGTLVKLDRSLGRTQILEKIKPHIETSK